VKQVVKTRLFLQGDMQDITMLDYTIKLLKADRLNPHANIEGDATPQWYPRF
jgi:hypothetical protein